MNEAQWFYEDRGARVGPVVEAEIKGLVRDRKIGHGTLVWHTGMSAWVTVEASELKEELSYIPPPLAKDRVSDLWVWLIALTPLLLLINQPKFAGACLTIVWLMSVAFCAMDIRGIRRAGHGSPSIWWSFWFVLVFGYLYLRSRRLEKSQAPLLVWILIFVTAIFLPGLLQENV